MCISENRRKPDPKINIAVKLCCAIGHSLTPHAVSYRLRSFADACAKRLQPKKPSSKGPRPSTSKAMKSSCHSSLEALTVSNKLLPCCACTFHIVAELPCCAMHISHNCCHYSSRCWGVALLALSSYCFWHVPICLRPPGNIPQG